MYVVSECASVSVQMRVVCVVCIFLTWPANALSVWDIFKGGKLSRLIAWESNEKVPVMSDCEAITAARAERMNIGQKRKVGMLRK